MFDERTGLSDKQINFCLEYLKDFNGKRAAISAGYSPKSAKSIANRMLTKDDRIIKYIKEQKEKLERQKIMDIQEIQERLTSMARGETEEDVIVVENTGDFSSEARVVQKKVSAKDQVKALELLGKINALFSDKNTPEIPEGVSEIKIKFVNKSRKINPGEKDPKIVGEYTPPSNTEDS